MAQRPPIAPLSLFTETRASIDSPKGSIIQIQVSPGSPFNVRQRSTRSLIQSHPPFDSQDAFNAHHLASTASIHHSDSSLYPRSFLWRVINDQKALEVRSVDPSKSDETQRDAIYTLHLCFGGQIKQGGVALADTDDPQLLNLFVLTRASELYTITLRRSFFCHAAASEEDPWRWCKIARPSTFSASPPHRLHALSSSDLLVSLSDGQIVHLARGKAGDGSKWIETRYGHDIVFGSLRGFVRWQGSNTVRYDGITLEQTTPLNMAMAPNGGHIFAVCMDHTLKAWNPEKSAAVFSQDLLWQDHDPHDMPKVMVNPAQATTLGFFTAPGFSTGDMYYIVTFSPHDLGQFKFWGVRDPDNGDLGIRDLFSDTVLIPPDPDPNPDSKAIWRVVDLKVRQKHEDGKLEFWLLMSSNRQCRLFKLQTELEELPNAWNKSWIATTMQTSEEHQLRPSFLADGKEAEGKVINEKWLRYLFAPGRYSGRVLESGLSIYCVDRGVILPSPKPPLARRLVAAIISRIAEDASETGHETQPFQIQREWTILWQQINDLNRSRYLAPSLALDKQTGMPWIVFADGCSSIRSCTRLEIMAFNAPEVLSVSHEYLELPSVETESGSDPKLPDELALVISTAATFRQSFSDSLRRNFDAALSEELWSRSQLSMPKRVERFSASCDFENEIEDGLLDELVHEMLAPIEGLKNLASDAFFGIMESFKHFLPEKSEDLFYTKVGHRLVINGARDIIYQRETILLDLLALVVIVDDIDPDENPMPFFDGPQIFEGLVGFLRKIKVMSWLVDNVRSKDTSSTNSKAAGDDQLDWRPTILETAFAVDLKPQSDEQQSSCEALTNDIQDLLQWVDGGNATVPWDEVLVHIQCNLLVHHELELAKDFQQFLPGTPWATYVRGRLTLLLGEVEEAAVNFRKAASRLSRPSRFEYVQASSNLISTTEALALGSGLPNYYSHIIDLFDSGRTNTPTSPTASAQVAHFAQLALDQLPEEDDSQTRTDLLQSLFYASITTRDFLTAFQAMTDHPSPHTLAPDLVTVILETPHAAPQLLDFEWPTQLLAQVDALIAKQASPQTLAAWRLHFNDFRGAAKALMPALDEMQERVKCGLAGANEAVLDKQYLTIVNLLSCAGPENAWVLSGGEDEVVKTGDGDDGDGANGLLDTGSQQKKKKRRKIVTVRDLREGYQQELDRRSVVESGNYAFGGGEDEGMDLL